MAPKTLRNLAPTAISDFISYSARHSPHLTAMASLGWCPPHRLFLKLEACTCLRV